MTTLSHNRRKTNKAVFRLKLLAAGVKDTEYQVYQMVRCDEATAIKILYPLNL